MPGRDRPVPGVWRRRRPSASTHYSVLRVQADFASQSTRWRRHASQSCSCGGFAFSAHVASRTLPSIRARHIYQIASEFRALRPEHSYSRRKFVLCLCKSVGEVFCLMCLWERFVDCTCDTMETAKVLITDGLAIASQ